MSECVNWPVLFAVIGAAVGLFVIVLLSGLLMRRLDARSFANADRLPVLTVEHQARPTNDIWECCGSPPLKITLKAQFGNAQIDNRPAGLPY